MNSLINRVVLGLFLGSIVFASSVFAESGSVTGTVEKIVLHQFNDDSAWDETVWFCVDDTEVVGGCGRVSHCSKEGNMALIISKNANPNIYSSVLAAKISKTTITVDVDDDYKFESFCMARSIHL